MCSLNYVGTYLFYGCKLMHGRSVTHTQKKCVHEMNLNMKWHVTMYVANLYFSFCLAI